MKIPAIFILTLWTLASLGYSDQPAPISLRISCQDKEVHVLISNNTEKSIKVFRQGSMWGDGQYFLVFKDKKTGKLFVSRRNKTLYTMNIPATQRIPAKESFEAVLDYGDGTWDLPDFEKFEIASVIFAPEVNVEALEQKVTLRRAIWNMKPESKQGKKKGDSRIKGRDKQS